MPDRNVNLQPASSFRPDAPPAPPQPAAQAAIRVKFGPRPDDDMPLSWAEKMLMQLKETQPKVFARLLTSVVIGQNGHQS